MSLDIEALAPRLSAFPYLICLDGGGSKTALAVLDADAQVLVQRTAGPTNPSNNSKEVILTRFRELLTATLPNGEDLAANLDKCFVIAGMAGVGVAAAQAMVLELFTEIGFRPDAVSLVTDAAMALSLVRSSGAVLIGGTGSICLARHSGRVYRVGGLGRLIADKGSGYDIGMQAIRAVLEEDQGWGEPTVLSAALRAQLLPEEPIDKLIMYVHNGKLSVTDVAAVAPLVFAAASEGDAIARKIIASASHDLANLLARAVEMPPLGAGAFCYAIGGLFKSENACLYDQIRQHPELKNVVLVNASRLDIAVEVGRELAVLRKAPHQVANALRHLPIAPAYADFQAYRGVFPATNHQFLTEERHPLTMNLSSDFSRDPRRGLEILQEADDAVVTAAQAFVDTFLIQLAARVECSLVAGGNVVILGAGSSGRIAVDIASKWNSSAFAASFAGRVLGKIAGGVFPFVRAKEGAEDSLEMGAETVSFVSSKDTIFLLSASGSARFNTGAGHASLQRGATVYYILNNPHPPAHAQELFMAGVQPVCVEVGPQAITGSTRLQAATFAEIALGIVLVAATQPQEERIARATTTVRLLGKANSSVTDQLTHAVEIVDVFTAAFRSSGSNFFRVRDAPDGTGYVTYLCTPSAAREAVMDAAEMPPTFSTNPSRKTDEGFRRRAEFRAYVFENKLDNVVAWSTLIGHELTQTDREEVESLIIASSSGDSNVCGSYAERPIGAGNALLLVLKILDPADLSSAKELYATASKSHSALAAVCLCSKALAAGVEFCTSLVTDLGKAVVTIFVDDEGDPLGVVATCTLKQILNICSNGSMLAMGKVEGNIMIDVTPANNKLIDRTIRILSSLINPECTSDYEALYHLVTRCHAYKRLRADQGAYVPPPVRLSLNLLNGAVSLSEACQLAS